MLEVGNNLGRNRWGQESDIDKSLKSLNTVPSQYLDFDADNYHKKNLDMKRGYEVTSGGRGSN